MTGWRLERISVHSLIIGSLTTHLLLVILVTVNGGHQWLQIPMLNLIVQQLSTH